MTNLQHLVNRIKLDTRMLEAHPERKEILEKRIEKSKRLIVECVMANDGNEHIQHIQIKEEPK